MSQSSQLSRLAALAIVVVAVLFTGNVFASTGYFTEESLKTADMTGISEGVERTLKAFDGRISRAKALARKLSGVEADMIATRVELAQRLRDYVAKRHRAGTQEMELLAWQGAEELRLFYAYFAAEQRRHADWAKNNRRPVVLNVRDFGAKGDGGTDDGPAFRAALAAVEDTSCGFLVKPICVQPGVTLTHSQIHGIEFAGNAFKLGKGVEPYAVANADDIVVDGQALVPFNRDVAAGPSDAAKRGAENFNRRMLEVSGGTPGGRRVVILGNSITLAARHDEIGWKHDCGMAASAPEKDYVHLFLKGLAKADPRGVEYRVKNIADFERDWAQYDLKRLDQLAAFKPDLLVVAIGENVANFPNGTAAFEARIAELIGRFRKGNPSCKVVVRGVFWPNPVKDAALSAVARRLGCAWVMASDLGARKECTAQGLFEHKGIAAHPGDVGMAALAERLVVAAAE